MSLLDALDNETNTMPLVLSEEGVAYVLAVHGLVDNYDFDVDTLASLCDAAGGPAEAREMLDDGIPAEYILSMGGAR